jgi:serpin B
MFIYADVENQYGELKMQKTNIIITILLTLALVLAGCGNNPIVDDNTNTNTDNISVKIEMRDATAQEVQSVVDSNNAFAFKFYDKLNEGMASENVFFSPYSITVALTMAFEGAKENTAEEMYNVLEFPECVCKKAPCNCDNADARRAAFREIYDGINKKSKDYQLDTGNALWAEQDFAFLDSYFNTIETVYGGKATNMDFKTKSEESRVIINKWVEDKTRDKIKDLIPAGMINSMTRLVLTNAIYFKGTWVWQFDKGDTYDANFKVNDEKNVTVKMMRLTGEKPRFNYTENEELQMLELPYKGNDVSMLIILPKEKSVNEIGKELSSEKLKELKSSMENLNLPVYLPKFKFETKSLLSDILQSMGMKEAFSDNADFSGMTGQKDLQISEVIHQAYVDVNEEGTEAAAATAIVMKSMSARPPASFKADHPFIFIIQQRDTGNILFMGKVMDPTK